MVEILAYNSGNINFDLLNELDREIYSLLELEHRHQEQIDFNLLHKIYILIENNKPIARVALYNNPDISFKNYKVALVGNYECVENDKYSRLILQHVFKHANKLGFNYVIGPMNGSTWYDYRFMTDMENPLFVTEPYYKKYYNLQFQKAEFETIAEYNSTIEHALEYNNDFIVDLEERMKSNGVVFRNIYLNDIENELIKIYNFSKSVFKHNFLYTAISQESFIEKYMKLTSLFKKEEIIIAEDNNLIVGLLFAFNDIYCKTEKRLIVKTLAVDSKYKYKGMSQILGRKVTKTAVSNGYNAIIHAFMYKGNQINNISSKFPVKNYRKYFLYGRTI